MLAPAIALHQVDKIYANGMVALQGLTLAVQPGEFVSLVGPSGCGDSTVLRLMAGLGDVSSGTIEGPAAGDQSLAFVFQEAALMPWATVVENVHLPLKLQGQSLRASRSQIQSALNRVALQGVEQSYPRQLSGGMKMRVSIARALATNPRLILMDEPFGALDPITKQNLIVELVAKQLFKDNTVVIVTHDLFEAITLGDTICLLDQGKAQQIGTPKDFLFHPTSQFVKEFFDSQRLRLEMQIVRLSEVYPVLQSDTGEAEDIVEIAPEQSIWEALEIIERKNLTQIAVGNSSLSLKITTPATLVKAFYLFKSNYLTPAAE